MRRFIRFALVAAVLALGIGVATPARAVDTAAYSWVVPCDDPDGVGTDETTPGFSFIPGTYALTAEGSCSYAVTGAGGFGVTTPCTVVVPVPCVGVTVSNIPGAACTISTSTLVIGGCTPGVPTVTTCGSAHVVRVDDVCLSTVPGTVGFTTVLTSRPMRASFVDTPGDYGDNVGAFVVTATRI